MKLWGKKYSLNKQVEDFTVGNDYVLDQALVKYDCQASLAHVKMLNKIGILTSDEAHQLSHELNNIIELDKKNQFIISKEQEDCHTAIENCLTEKLGELGKKIHTARSRNDQVLTALRLYYKAQLAECQLGIDKFNTVINNFISRYGDIEFPGFTHTRKAMPSSITLWASAFRDSMVDNSALLQVTLTLVDQCPLGTGAGYGVPLEIDREMTAKELNFVKVQTNPIYTQLSRGKFEATILHTLSQIMFDLNKISSDLILFSMPEFGYFELPDEFCTGSSIMPHKHNPDVLELVRSRYHIIIGYENQIKMTTSNLISGYHRDIQLTKEPVMKSFDIVGDTLAIMVLIFENLKVNQDRCRQAMTKELFATSEAYQLVKQGVPFREAYQRIASQYINKHE
jgi:argininosuccinate lyase